MADYWYFTDAGKKTSNSSPSFPVGTLYFNADEKKLYIEIADNNGDHKKYYVQLTEELQSYYI